MVLTVGCKGSGLRTVRTRAAFTYVNSLIASSDLPVSYDDQTVGNINTVSTDSGTSINFEKKNTR